MRLLLDTHVALWALSAPTNINDVGRALIADPDNQIYVSVVSIWEIAIKRALGRRGAPGLSADTAVRHFASAGYAVLEITVAHAAATETLPLIHADPFDRLLVAQAISEPMHLLTRDSILFNYAPLIIQV